MGTVAIFSVLSGKIFVQYTAFFHETQKEGDDNNRNLIIILTLTKTDLASLNAVKGLQKIGFVLWGSFAIAEFIPHHRSAGLGLGIQTLP